MTRKKRDKLLAIKEGTSDFVLSKNVFIYSYLLFSFGPETMAGFITVRKDSSSLLQTIICEVIFVLPMHFLMTLIGHYSQSSCIAIGWMQPILAGFSFCVIVATILSILNSFLMLRDVCIYLAITMTTGGEAYLQCNHFASVPTFCIDYITTDEEMIQQETKQGYPLNTTNLVTYLFYSLILIRKDEDSNDPTLSLQRVTLKMVYGVLNFLMPVLLFFMAQIKFSNTFKVFKPIALMILSIYCIAAMAMVFVAGGFEELKNFLLKVTDRWRYLDISRWLMTLMERVMAYEPLHIYHIGFAAMLDPKTDTEVAVVESWVFVFLARILQTCLYLTIKGAVHRDRVETTISSLTIGTEYVTVMFPEGLDYLSTGDTFIVNSYYGCLFAAWCLKISLATQLIFNSLIDIIPFAVSYKKYILATFFGVCAIFLHVIFSSKTLDTEHYWLIEFQVFPMWVALVLFSVFTLWFYGVTNLCDDFHFKVGHPPSFFWKIFLWPIPFSLFLTLMLMLNRVSEVMRHRYQEGQPDNSLVFLVVIQLIYAVPFAICMIYEIIHYILSKKLLWLVKPQERWGDPDPEERKARRKYPPRLETKFRRRFDYCKHRCLRYNKVLHALDEREYDTRAALLNLPQELIEEKNYIYSILRRINNKEK